MPKSFLIFELLMFQYLTEERLIIVPEHQFVYLITLNTMWTLFDTLSKMNEINDIHVSFTDNEWYSSKCEFAIFPISVI